MVKNLLSRLCAAALLCLCANEAALGQALVPPVPDTVVVRRLTGPIVFDGLSDEPAWTDAFQMGFTVFSPVWGGAPSERTEMLLAFDDTDLYVAGRCYTRDSSTLVIRNLVRDGWRGDDWVTFHIDNNFDRQNALVFSIYPLGSRYDAAVSNDAVDLGTNTFNQDFNMFWDARSVVNGEGWFFEMKIPLYNLRLRKGAQGDVRVGISGARTLQHHQEVHLFPPIAQNVIDAMSKPSAKQPALLEDIVPQRLLLATPYLLASQARTYEVASPGGPYLPRTDRSLQAGLDLKAGLSPYLTLDVSLNPDFAQVEADDQLLNLTRFSLFFPEKRLFFQEAAGLFEFNLGGNTQLFYSRQIGIREGRLSRVYGGARLTGKLDARTDIGVLNMQTAPVRDEAGALLGGTENFSALRLRRRAFNERSFVGVMATNRWSADANNTALGLDALLNPFGEHYFQVVAGATKDAGAPFATTASRLNLLWELRQTDGLFGSLGYTYSGADFDPRTGFLDRSDFHRFTGQASLGKFAEDRRGRFQYRYWDMLRLDAIRGASSGQWESLEAVTELGATTFKGLDLFAYLSQAYERLDEPLSFSDAISIAPGSYWFPEAGLGFFEPRAKALRHAAVLRGGGFFGGQRFAFSYDPILNLGRHWELQGRYTFNHLRFASGVRESIHIGRLRVGYALDLHLSINYVVQYNSLARRVFNNLRLRYNFQDGHDLFLVWNEDFFTERFDGLGLPRPLSGSQNFILKYNVTFDRLLRGRAARPAPDAIGTAVPEEQLLHGARLPDRRAFSDFRGGGRRHDGR